MNDIIYENKDLAKVACEKYNAAVRELQCKMGVWESSEDSCSGTFIHARYRTAEGKIEEYCHW